MNENDENIIEVTPDVNGAQEIVANTLCKAGYIADKLASEINTVSPNSLIAADKGGTKLTLDTTEGFLNISQNSRIKREVQEITEEQRRKALQYQQDKEFYEKQILQQTRSAAAINEDYIKILHPTYRTKFIEAISRYGTLAAGLRYMKQTYGISVRADVLRRLRALIPAFSAEIEDAQAMYQGSLQIAMHERAVEGVEKIIRDREGNEIGRERIYSDSLLAKMVDVHTPEYKEARQKENQKGNTINVQIIKDFHQYKSKGN